MHLHQALITTFQLVYIISIKFFTAKLIDFVKSHFDRLQSELNPLTDYKSYNNFFSQ